MGFVADSMRAEMDKLGRAGAMLCCRLGFGGFRPLGFFEPRTHASDGRWPLSEALIILQSVVQQEQQHRDLETEGSEACIALRSFGLIGMFAAEDVVPGYQHGMRISKYEFEQLLVEPQTLGAISRELPRKLYTQNYIVRRTKKRRWTFRPQPSNPIDLFR